MSNSYLSIKKIRAQHKFEVILLLFVLIATLTGIVVCFISKKYFENVYTVEDGFIENFTVLPLSIAVIVALRYLLKLAKYKSWMFILCMAGAALFSFFIAGEEISWGQRIFHIQTPEFFKEHNSQDETNIHNLILDGVRVNHLIFSLLLTVVIGIYLLFLPIFYDKNNRVKKFINWAGIPIARPLHIVSAVILFILIGLISSGKNSEILEMGISSIFLLILIYPQNKEAFSRTSSNNRH
jgi:hypothetical protein